MNKSYKKEISFRDDNCCGQKSLTNIKKKKDVHGGMGGNFLHY